MSTTFDHLYRRDLPEQVRAEDPQRRRTRGAGLALSGGGYRAMLFHVGALRRLYEIGALQHVRRISSVSGGSIAAVQLALHWDELIVGEPDIDRFVKLVEQPCLDHAGQLLDVSGGLLGFVTPRRSIAHTIAKTYNKWFDDKTLQHLPDSTRFVFCATNLGTGSVVRFSKEYMADYRVGKRDAPTLRLGDIVAASAAFPPVLSPMRIRLDSDQALTEQFDGDNPPLRDTDYACKLELSDGGVYDNLGLQSIEQFTTLLVSDGGGPFQYDDDVATNWLQHMIRCWKVTDNQVRSLRRSALIDQYDAGSRFGAFWGISTLYSEYPNQSLKVDDSWTDYLRSISTRLAPVDDTRKRQLVNFSYCLCDAAIRSYVTNDPLPPPTLPYPQHPLDGPAPDRHDKAAWKFWQT